jgi:hypothetical protein
LDNELSRIRRYIENNPKNWGNGDMNNLMGFFKIKDESEGMLE